MKITKKIEKGVNNLVKKNTSSIIVQAIMDADKEEKDAAKAKEHMDALVERVRSRITVNDKVPRISIENTYSHLGDYEKQSVIINTADTKMYTRPFPGKLYFDVKLFYDIQACIKEYELSDKEHKARYEKRVRDFLNSFKDQPIKLYLAAIVENITKIRGSVYGFSSLRTYLSYVKSIKSFFTHPLNMHGSILNFSTYEKRNTAFHEDIKEACYYYEQYKKAPISPYILNNEDIIYLKYIQETYFNTLSQMANQF